MNVPVPPVFETHELGEGLVFLTGRLPASLVWDAAGFEAAWGLRPDERPIILLHGRRVRIPRWQQAYGSDYHFSGQTSRALPVPDLLAPVLAWSKAAVHPALNGILLNWYEGSGHYIGPHHDSVRSMVPGTPIVTVSFGEVRKFRLTAGKPPAQTVRDFAAADGSVFVLPQETNAIWKHAVPKSTRYTGRRISVTIRAFSDEAKRRY